MTAAAAFGLFYALRALAPLWLFWGVWACYVAGGVAWCAYMVWDTRRMERKHLEALRNLRRDAQLIADYYDERPRPPAVH
jgi:uncharacterized membrane protein YccC